VSDRSVRRYIQVLKQEISFKQARYYEPAIQNISFYSQHKPELLFLDKTHLSS